MSEIELSIELNFYTKLAGIKKTFTFIYMVFYSMLIITFAIIVNLPDKWNSILYLSI